MSLKWLQSTLEYEVFRIYTTTRRVRSRNQSGATQGAFSKVVNLNVGNVGLLIVFFFFHEMLATHIRHPIILPDYSQLLANAFPKSCPRACSSPPGTAAAKRD